MLRIAPFASVIDTVVFRSPRKSEVRTLPEIVTVALVGVTAKFAVYVVGTVGRTLCEIAPPSLQLLQSYLAPVVC